MKLHELTATPGSVKDRKRIGRGMIKRAMAMQQKEHIETVICTGTIVLKKSGTKCSFRVRDWNF